MFTLAEMSMEELLVLEKEIKKEIEVRNRGNQKMVIYTHDCFDCSKSHMSKYKHWAKRVEHVDTTKANGFAFLGEFLDTRRENRVPEGSIVVEICDTDLKCYEILKEGKVLKCEGNSMSMATFIDKVAEIMI